MMRKSGFPVDLHVVALSSVSQHCLLKRWPTCRFLLTNSSAGFMVLPTSVVNTGQSPVGGRGKCPRSLPESWGAEAAWRHLSWRDCGRCGSGETLQYPHLFFPPQSQGNGLSLQSLSRPSLHLKKSFLLFLSLFLLSGAPLFSVLRDWLSRISGSPQTCCVAVRDLEIRSSCQDSPASDVFK